MGGQPWACAREEKKASGWACWRGRPSAYAGPCMKWANPSYFGPRSWSKGKIKKNDVRIKIKYTKITTCD